MNTTTPTVATTSMEIDRCGTRIPLGTDINTRAGININFIGTDTDTLISWSGDNTGIAHYYCFVIVRTCKGERCTVDNKTLTIMLIVNCADASVGVNQHLALCHSELVTLLAPQRNTCMGTKLLSKYHTVVATLQARRESQFNGAPLCTNFRHRKLIPGIT